MDEVIIFTVGLSLTALVCCCLFKLLVSMKYLSEDRKENTTGYNLRHPRRYSYGSDSKTSVRGADGKKRRQSLTSPSKQPSDDIVPTMHNKGLPNRKMKKAATSDLPYMPYEPSLIEKVLGTTNKQFKPRERAIPKELTNAESIAKITAELIIESAFNEVI